LSVFQWTGLDNADLGGEALAVLDEGHVVHPRRLRIKVTGSYTTANFKLTSDGLSGSLISYAASAAHPIGEPFSPIVPQVHVF